VNSPTQNVVMPLKK